MPIEVLIVLQLILMVLVIVLLAKVLQLKKQILQTISKVEAYIAYITEDEQEALNRPAKQEWGSREQTNMQAQLIHSVLQEYFP